MPRRSHLSIPHQLQQLKAQEIYEQRIAKGKNGSPQGDWETARRYLTRYPQVVRAWKRHQAIAFYQQLPKAFFRRLWRSLKALIGVIGKIITFPFWLFYKLPQLFANTDTRPFALDVVKTLISAASLIAAIIAAIGLFVNYQDAIEDRRLTQERLITNLFSKAVEQRSAKLIDAKNLTNKQIKSACFWEEAIYSDAEWDDLEEKSIVKDQIANQKRIEEIKQDKASNPANPPDCKR